MTTIRQPICNRSFDVCFQRATSELAEHTAMEVCRQVYFFIFQNQHVLPKSGHIPKLNSDVSVELGSGLLAYSNPIIRMLDAMLDISPQVREIRMITGQSAVKSISA